jgi:putative peptide zinc metalloprotease protein
MGLPLLREELALFPSHTLGDGQPSWTLHDPVRNQFFRIDWQGFEILSRWHLDDANEIVEAIGAETSLKPALDDVEMLHRFLFENQLLRPNGEEPIKNMVNRLLQMRGKWHQWLLHHYLFFRIPLVKPDSWLTSSQQYVQFFFSSFFFRLSLVVLVLGIVEVSRDWERFQSSLVDMMSWQGIFAYGMALIFVKILHELGHAYTAKRYGCRIPTMGVAFLVLWPVAYTDTNDVWRLQNRPQRLKVAAAGVLTELTVAAWATLLWAILPEGTLKAMAFVLSTSTWISSLLINISPFMRFDGYFLLSDFLDMPNLHTRSFVMAKWHLRERLFALGEPPPEYFSKRFTLFMVVFAYATWLYRLVLFLGIAVLVYTFFIKAIGIFLFAVEIVWFILLPVWREMKSWHQLWPVIRTRARTRRSLLLFVLFLASTLVPWPSRIVTSGLLKPSRSLVLYAPTGAQLVHLPWRDGDKLPEGANILTLASPELKMRWDRAKARVQRTEWLAESVGVDALQRSNMQVAQQEFAVAKAELQQVEADIQLFSPVAPFAGQLRDLDPDLRIGAWLGKHEKIATLVADGEWQIETYLDEEEVQRVRVGDRAMFMPDEDANGTLSLTVKFVDKDATHVLSSGILAVPAGGSVVVREKHGQLIPERASYRIILSLNDDAGTLGKGSWRGQVVIRAEWEAPALRYIRAFFVLLWRELGM